MKKYPFIKMLMLEYMTENEEMTGYEFINYCSELGISVSNGTVYPHLQEMMDKEFVTCRAEKNKKYYKVTKKGRRFAKQGEKVPRDLKREIFKIMFRNRDIDWRETDQIEQLANDIEKLSKFINNKARNIKLK